MFIVRITIVEVVAFMKGEKNNVKRFIDDDLRLGSHRREDWQGHL